MRNQILINFINESTSLKGLKEKATEHIKNHPDKKYCFNLEQGKFRENRITYDYVIETEKEIKEEYLDFIKEGKECILNNDYLFLDGSFYLEDRDSNIYFYDKLKIKEKAIELIKNNDFGFNVEEMKEENLKSIYEKLSEKYDYVQGCHGRYFIFDKFLILFSCECKSKNKIKGSISFLTLADPSLKEILKNKIKGIYNYKDTLENKDPKFTALINEIFDKITY